MHFILKIIKNCMKPLLKCIRKTWRLIFLRQQIIFNVPPDFCIMSIIAQCNCNSITHQLYLCCCNSWREIITTCAPKNAVGHGSPHRNLSTLAKLHAWSRSMVKKRVPEMKLVEKMYDGRGWVKCRFYLFFIMLSMATITNAFYFQCAVFSLSGRMAHTPR